MKHIERIAVKYKLLTNLRNQVKRIEEIYTRGTVLVPEGTVPEITSITIRVSGINDRTITSAELNNDILLEINTAALTILKKHTKQEELDLMQLEATLLKVEKEHYDCLEVYRNE